jgi:hypothetical protein
VSFPCKQEPSFGQGSEPGSQAAASPRRRFSSGPSTEAVQQGFQSEPACDLVRNHSSFYTAAGEIWSCSWEHRPRSHMSYLGQEPRTSARSEHHYSRSQIRGWAVTQESPATLLCDTTSVSVLGLPSRLRISTLPQLA